MLSLYQKATACGLDLEYKELMRGYFALSNERLINNTFEKLTEEQKTAAARFPDGRYVTAD